MSAGRSVCPYSVASLTGDVIRGIKCPGPTLKRIHAHHHGEVMCPVMLTAQFDGREGNALWTPAKLQSYGHIPIRLMSGGLNYAIQAWGEFTVTASPSLPLIFGVRGKSKIARSVVPSRPRLQLFAAGHSISEFNKACDLLHLPQIPEPQLMASVGAVAEVNRHWLPHAPHRLQLRALMVGNNRYLLAGPSNEATFVLFGTVGSGAMRCGTGLCVTRFRRAWSGGPGRFSVGAAEPGPHRALMAVNSAQYATSFLERHRATRSDDWWMLWMGDYGTVEMLGDMNVFFLLKRNYRKRLLMKKKKQKGLAFSGSGQHCSRNDTEGTTTQRHEPLFCPFTSEEPGTGVLSQPSLRLSKQEIDSLENHILITPELTDTIPNRSTRALLLAAARGLGLPVEERSIPLDELKEWMKHDAIEAVLGSGDHTPLVTLTSLSLHEPQEDTKRPQGINNRRRNNNKTLKGNLAPSLLKTKNSNDDSEKLENMFNSPTDPPDLNFRKVADTQFPLCTKSLSVRFLYEDILHNQHMGPQERNMGLSIL